MAMEVYNPNNEGFNYTDTTRQLFDAMLTGKPIKSITCMKGWMNRNKPELDFTMTNVVATNYYVGMGSNHDGSVQFDLVDIEPQYDTDPPSETDEKPRDQFYMNWVRSFEL